MANFEGIAQDFSRENSRTNFREAYRQYHPNDSSLSARSHNQSQPNTGRRVSVDVSDVTPREVITSTDSFTKKQQQQQQQQHKLSADDDDNNNNGKQQQHSINNFAQPDDDQKNTTTSNSGSNDNNNNNNGEETSSAPENPYLLRTDCQQFLLVLFLVINIVFGGGLWIAVQSYYGPLEDRGFCSAKCNNHNSTTSSSSTTTCNAQRQCLAQPVNLGMSLLNLLGVVFGALGDILGGVTGFILGNIICIFGPMLFAIDVEEGTGYSIAVPLCAVGCALSFFAVLSQLIPKYMNPERIGLSCSTFTSFWDTAIAVAPIIGIMMSSTNLTIFQIFIIVGAVSIPSTIAVLCLVHNHSRVLAKEEYDRSNSTANVSLLTTNNDHDNNDNYGTVSSTTSDNINKNNNNNSKKNDTEEEQQQEQQPKESFFHVARRVIANWRFVALTCGASSTVTYGYFIMTNLGLLVSSHGAEVNETHDFERDASIIMGILGGATGLFIGKLIDAANWRFRCRVIAVVQTVMLGVTGVLVAIESIPWKLQYLTFVIITFWRMFGFAGINSSFNKAMFEAGDGAAAGVGLGLIYSIAGGISLIVGRFGTELAHHGHFQEVHLILIIVCAICHLIQAAFGY